MPQKAKTKTKVFFSFDAHHRLLISLGAAAITFFFSWSHCSAPTVALVTWIAFGLCIIIMDWIIILTANPAEIRKIASIEDSSRTLIFLFVIVSSLMSLLAIVFLLLSTKNQSDAVVTARVLLAMASVIVSWWLVHTIFTLRYAHMYYTTDPDDDKKLKHLGGLEFPGDEKEPDYLDFVYFSFVLGMTFQVSDVEISARSIRRLAWLHGLISFAFNTAIVALSINVISGMISK